MKLAPPIATTAASWWAEGADALDRFEGGQPLPAEEAEALVKAWRASVGDDHWARRLAWSGWDETRFATLGPPALNLAALPAWISWVEAALALAEGGAADGPLGPWSAWCGALPPKQAAFAEVLAPFVAVAWQGLHVPQGMLSAEAAAALQMQLLGRLRQVAAPTLLADWELARGPLPEGEGPVGSARHQAWVAGMLGGGWRRLLAAYPALARLLGLVVGQLQMATQAVLDAVVADAPRWQALHGGDPWGQVVAWAGQLSDVHDGGQSVVRVGFASGLDLFFKPRCLKLEQAFDGLWTWLQAQGMPLDHLPLRRLLGEGHGWVEAVRHEPCADEAAVVRFFRRSGQLLAVLHMLDGSDFHAENLIAAGEHPVPIDLEGLFQPRVVDDHKAWQPFADDDALRRQMTTSVLMSSYLNAEMVRGKQVAMDAGGLAMPPAGPREAPGFLGAGTDALRLGLVALPERWQNLPLLDGQPQAPTGDRRVALVEGFLEAFALLMAKREAILAPGGPWEAFHAGELRLFFRNTDHYENFRQRAFRPEALRSGLGRRLLFERLTRTYRLAEKRPDTWPLIEMEMRALEQGDVPAFRLRATAEGFDTDAGFVRLFPGGALAQARARFQAFTEREGDFQAQLIRLALPSESPTHRVAEPLAEGAEPLPALSPEAAQAAGLALLEGLLPQSVPLANGSLMWLDRVPSSSGALLPGLMGPGLMDGASGFAVVLGAAYALSGEERWRQGALATILPLRGAMKDSLNIPPDRADAWGGAIHSLVVLGELLGERALGDEAAAAVRQMPYAVQLNAHSDVVGGLAGAAWGVAAAAIARPDHITQQAAILLGDRLLNMALVGQGGLPTWPSLMGRPVPGMAHGAAGVATAFQHLHRATGVARYAEAAEEALAWEADWWRPALGTWVTPPESPGGEELSRIAWCHGTPGGLLARLAVGPEKRLGEVEAAVAGLLAAEDHPIDFACCGNAGRVEALLSAGQALQRPDWVDAARRLAARRLALGPSTVANAPSFLRGAGGVAYGLFRLAAPQRLPSLLQGQAFASA